MGVPQFAEDWREEPSHENEEAQHVGFEGDFTLLGGGVLELSGQDGQLQDSQVQHR